MDWLKKVPIGQYVPGQAGWLRNLDPRLKMAWALMFLLTPFLAGPIWRVGLVVGLFLLTFLSGLPFRIWLRSFGFVLVLAGLVGLLTILLPTGQFSSPFPIRSPQEVPNVFGASNSWNLVEVGPIRFGGFELGSLAIGRRSAELGLKTSTLIFTVVHSVNLLLLTTSPEDLVWTLHWFISPLALLGVPVDRISFQLLLSLRFLPLVQEEFQNLLRALSTRAVNLKQLGFKATFGLVVSVGERLLANILLRAEQGADALVARGGLWLPPDHFRPNTTLKGRRVFLNFCSGITLLFVLGLRGKYGAL